MVEPSAPIIRPSHLFFPIASFGRYGSFLTMIIMSKNEFWQLWLMALAIRTAIRTGRICDICPVSSKTSRAVEMV